MDHKQNAERYFAEELAYIQNKEIKDFVLNVFDKLVPDYFWTVPCSTSSKYHPKVSLGVGGLVRHTKLAVWWGIELSRAMSLESRHDEIVATLLLHDLIKNGKGLDVNGNKLDDSVSGTHGVTLANRIMREILPHHVDSTDDPFFRMLWGIAGHMGIWTTDTKYQPINIEDSDRRTFANLIHLADYCASRKVDAEMLKLSELKIEDSDGS